MGKVAFVFAGQGAQTVGMGQELYNTTQAAKQVFEMAESRRPGTLSMCFEGPAEQLNITVNTQPCLFTMDLACARALHEASVTAEGVAGFSLGEIPALCFAGIMDDAQAFDFVCYRAKVMQECADINGGTMFAILKLSAEKVETLCSSLPNAFPVNYNCEGQTVVACSLETAEKLPELIATEGGKAVKLAVSGAFHSPFMNEASIKIAAYLQSVHLSPMKIPLYSNTEAAVYTDAKSLLARQVNSPVLWQKTIEAMTADGFDTFIEVGAGKTLSGLIKKINPNASIYYVCDTASLENTVAALKA